MRKYILLAVFIIGLIYIMAPGPTQISDFPPIPDSLKSDEPGDTHQTPNIAAYFSNYDREGITNYYRDDFKNKYFFGKIIPPISLNYPPRAAYTYVRDLQMSTFLEEYVYPLRGSVFVNGYEPIIESQIRNIPVTAGDIIHINGQYFKSKTTIRFYPNEWYVRLLVYVGIWGASYALFILYRKTLKEKQ